MMKQVTSNKSFIKAPESLALDDLGASKSAD